MIETKGLLKFELGEKDYQKLAFIAEKAGVTPGELIPRLLASVTDIPAENVGKTAKAEERGKTRHLLILAEVPEKWAAAMEYGPGVMETWTEESLGCSLEGDFDGGQWSQDVEKYFGVSGKDARDAIDVHEARFVNGEVAEKVEELLYPAPRIPSVIHLEA